MSDPMNMIILTGIAISAALGILAARFGVEQRPGFDERPEAYSPHHYGLR
jgi:hypothetical protein